MKLEQMERKILLLSFGISGAAALIYEVVWTRELSLILGSTVYAVSTMLTAFMSGLALGSYLGGMAGDKYKNTTLLFSLCEFGTGIFGLLSIPLIKLLPPFYFFIYTRFHLKPELFFSLQFILCMLIMLVPTTLMGATFPLASKAMVSGMNEVSRQVGGLYSFNTLGAVAGSFSAGFILIPTLGMKTSTIIAGSANIAAGLLLVFISRKKNFVPSIMLIAVFSAIAVPLARGPRSSGYNYSYYKNGRFKSIKDFKEEWKNIRLVDYMDDIHGTIKVFIDHGNKSFFLENGGKIEGSTSSDIPNELLLAYLPLSVNKSARDFLVIGLGTGMTLKAAKGAVGNVECVEINYSVARAVQKYFFPDLFDEKVTLHFADARNFLMLTDKKYDIISSEPSYPTDSTAGNLFTREYFQIAASRLKPGGVYAQWLPYYLLRRDGVTTMVKTFAASFPYIYIWKVPISQDLIMIGSKKPFTMDEEQVRMDVAQMNEFPLELPFVLSKSPSDVNRIIRKAGNLPYNDDDRPVVEFLAAKTLTSND